MSMCVKAVLAASAFFALNLAFGGITLTFHGVPFGIVALIFAGGFGLGMLFKSK